MVNNERTVPVRSPRPGTVSTRVPCDKKDNAGNEVHTAIQRGTRDIVVLAPPLEVALANNKLEYEPDREPGRVVDARRRRDEGYTD